MSPGGPSQGAGQRAGDREELAHGTSAPGPDGPSPDASSGDGGGGEPEFGPGGYLPQRAAARARKIVLRAELGLQWVIASIVAGVILLVAGVLWWRAGSELPARYEPVIAAEAVDEPGEAATAGRFFVLNDAGRVRAFALVEPSLTYCRETGNLEARTGPGERRVWSVTGRSLDGGAGLAQYPVTVADDTVQADPTRPLPAPAGRDEGVEPACLTDDPS